MPEGQISPVGDDAAAIPCLGIHARTPPAVEQAAVYGLDRDVFVTISSKNKAEGPATLAALPPAEVIAAHAAAAR